MKRVLITGANSYVGTNVEKWLMREPDKYDVETLDMKDPNWKEFDFSKFDVVFHVAGIAHVSTKKNMKDLYFKINTDLAIQTAEKAKNSGVKQFIFMSSMIIYGMDNNIGDRRHIDIIKFNPVNSYGQSKLEADLKIQQLHNTSFNVLIIRTPIIYGPGCKGNFPKVQKIALKLFIVPKIENQKSMLYIDNFSEFLKKSLDSNLYGVYYPQNSRFLSTIEIVKLTRNVFGKETKSTIIFNFLIKFVSKYSMKLRNIFGNKTYDLTINQNDYLFYNLVDVEESIRICAIYFKKARLKNEKK